MGFRMRKSIKIAPGIRVNISNKSIGVSAGVKGLRYSVNSSGRKTVTASIPGTGISYSKSIGSGSKKSYKSAAYQKNRELKSAYDRIKDKEEQLEQNRLKVELFENKLEMIKSIHMECDEPVDWIKFKNMPNPLDEKGVGNNQIRAINNLNGYTPTWIDKLFRRTEKKIKRLEEELQEAIKRDQQDYEEWTRIINLANKVTSGDEKAYSEVIEEFKPLEDLLEFGSRFKFNVKSSSQIEVEFEINTEQVIPKEEITLTKAGNISTKTMTKTKFYDIQQDYVCSCIIRIARDLFALLPLSEVIIHATDTRLNTERGVYEQMTIVSVKIDRVTLNELNMKLIDPSDAMNNFKHYMVFKKTKGFEAVQRIQ